MMTILNDTTIPAATLVTVDQLSAILGVRKSWIYAHTRPTCPFPLPCVKVGKYLRFDLVEVLAHFRAAAGIITEE